ncbi:MAG: hypothetical protein NTV61_09295 [Candidatus Bathyarchaeota archaeon]|nr:hypothetical protein [Candidatus Bathyarchaeota archaeon]
MAKKKLILNEDDLLFLDTLHGCGFEQASEGKLREKLQEHGMAESTYNAVRRKLLFARFIGAVYGNLTLEKKDYRPQEAKGDEETAEQGA